jgi:hypothetical protein
MIEVKEMIEILKVITTLLNLYPYKDLTWLSSITSNTLLSNSHQCQISFIFIFDEIML